MGKRRGVATTLLMPLALALSGCAARSSRSFSIDSNVDFGYPSPATEDCGVAVRGSVLEVLVRDETHVAMVGVVVWAIAADNVDERRTVPLAVRTDTRGVAAFNVGGGRYAVFVAREGFAPEAKGLYLRFNCSARMTITLRLGDRPLS